MQIRVSTATTGDLPAALEHFDRLPDSAHVRLPVVCGLRGCSPATVWRHVKAGLIPKPEKIGLNISAWRVGSLRRALGVQQ